MDEKKSTNQKHIRIKYKEVEDQIIAIQEEYHLRENHIINEALSFGLPILIEHLKTPGGLEPASDMKLQEVLNNLKKNEKLLKENTDIQMENKDNQLLIMANQEILLAMMSSLYSRYKLAWSYESYYPTLAEAQEQQLDFTIPPQYKKLKDQYTRAVLSDEEEDEE